MGKSRIAVLCISFVALAVYLWHQRFVDVEIAGIKFRVPNPTVVSASSMRKTSGGLDSTHGVFLELPNGPYYGRWGILLEPSDQRKAKGFPSPFDAMVVEEKSTYALTLTASGWYRCAESCGRDVWYFRRKPMADDSIYSVQSVVCHKTEICELLFAYRGVDVTVSLQQNKIEDASKVVEEAIAILSSYTVVEK